MKKAISVLMLFVMLFMLVPAVHAASGNEPGEQSEVVELREKNSQTFRLEDGSYECVVYAEDKYFEDDSGELVEIDNTVVPQKSTYGGKEYSYTNRADSTHIAFAENEPAVLVSSKARSLAFGLQTEGAAGVSLGGLKNIEAIAGYPLSGDNMLAYTGALQSTDIVYEVRNGAVKEYIVLYDASAPTEFTFTYDTEGYTAAYTEFGTVGFYDAAGELCFELSNLFAVDSAEAYTEALTYNIGEAANGKTAVTVSLSEEYAHDPERAYPVLIDPSTMITGEYNTQDSYVSSKYPTTNYYMNTYLRMGYDSNYYVRRTYIRFNLPSSIPSYAITNAYINLKLQSCGNSPSIKAYRVIDNWTSSNINWNNKPGFSSLLASDTASLASNNWYRLYVKDIVKMWYDGTLQNYGFMIKNATESGTGYWSTFYSSDAASPNKPELRIEYSANVYTITYNGNGHTFGTVPSPQQVIAGNSLAVAGQGKLEKAGSCIFQGWCTNSSGTGTTYSVHQVITPSSNMTLYAKWSSPIYAHRYATMKVWVDYTFINAQNGLWADKINEYVEAAADSFYQTFNITILMSSPFAIESPKSECENAPLGCDDTCVVGCNNHHTNANNLLDFISINGSTLYSFNTLLYYGTTTCWQGVHEKGVDGLAYLPGAGPGVQASMVRCNTYSTNMDWGTVRRMQHEWSHGYGAQHTGDGGTVCTSNCINNSGFNNSFLPVADVWCSRCKTAMSAHLGDY